jgi:acyl carrier protein
MSKLFGLSADAISEESSPATIPKWDSLAHMNLVLALEEEFGVQFTDDEIPELNSVARILSALENKGLDPA